MINVGIVGGESEAAGELIRILINHPDVIIRGVAAPDFAGQRVDKVHRGLTGDTDICFVNAIDPTEVNCVFLVGESWQAKAFLDALEKNEAVNADESDEETRLRVIDLTGSFLNGEREMVYGFPEFNRKALVRGAVRTSIPSAIAIVTELALFPLVKNHLLTGVSHAAVTLPDRSLHADGCDVNRKEFSADYHTSELSTRFDPIAPTIYRPDTETAAAAIVHGLREIDPGYEGSISLSMSTDMSRRRGMTVTVDVPCQVNADQVRLLYDEAYTDHGFTFPVDRKPVTADVANTNKCLIAIEDAGDVEYKPDNSPLRITAVIDDIVKGCAGTAVHCMNLLFGLSEKTGLTLKASAL